MIDGMPSAVADAKRVICTVCVPCADGKMVQSSIPRSSTATTKCELVHTRGCQDKYPICGAFIMADKTTSSDIMLPEQLGILTLWRPEHSIGGLFFFQWTLMYETSATYSGLYPYSVRDTAEKSYSDDSWCTSTMVAHS